MTAVAQEAGFPIAWDDPADAEKCWRYDPVHMPNALSPLGFELALSPFLQGFGWGMRPIQINYFPFFTIEPQPDNRPPQIANDPAGIREAGRRWHEEVLPEVLALTEPYRTTDFDALSNDDLASEIERLREVRFRAGQLHTMAITPHWMGMQLLIDTYKELTGGDQLDALRLAQGHLNKSVEAGERLWEVSRIAAATRWVRERLLTLDSENAAALLAQIESDPDGGEFVTAFRDYLDEFGWRNGGGIENRTWAEDPTTPLTMLRSYIETENYDPVAERSHLAAERETAIAETLAALDEAGQQRIEDVLDAVKGVCTLSEDHNYYIDQRLYTMPRRLLLAAGRRLAAAAALEKPHDIFHLRVREVVDALGGRTDGLRETALRRKEELARWRNITPPPYIGAPPPEGAPAPAVATERAAPAGELRGTAASAGVARGPARILRTLDESDRLRPGDVLVCPVTQPAWTPLFAVACAIVTEVGAVLGHTAIVAREYGIPAVIAVRNATRELRDGQLIEVDGSAGIVRVLA